MSKNLQKDIYIQEPANIPPMYGIAILSYYEADT